MKNRKKLLFILFPLLILLILLGRILCHPSFSTYTSRLFRQELAQDTITLHYTLSDPEAYGFKNMSASLGDFTYASFQKRIQNLKDQQVSLQNFLDQDLSEQDTMTAELLDWWPRQGGRIMVYFEKQEKERIEMKMISWNVNGLRAAVGKGFLDYFKEADADIFSIQETKLQEGQIDLPTEGYHQYWNYAEKKGYSGVAVFTKQEPISVSYGLGIEEHDKEGRVITLEFENFYHVTVYTPNSQQENARLDYRMTWDDALRAYLQELDKTKPVIVCGDLNVAHTEIDLKNPSTNRRNAGFTDEERGKFTELLEAGFVDTFRHFYPDVTGAYSWWSYRFNARKNNAGWRIDYYVVSERLRDALQDAKIHSDIMGSDHCPVELDIAL